MSSAMVGNWGVEFQSKTRARFQLWAPDVDCVRVELRGRLYPMEQLGNGWFSVSIDGVSAGERYWFVLPDGTRVADPASHVQPEGPLAPSSILDPSYRWQNPEWKGRAWHEAIVYELHIGTFTKEGTYTAAQERLPDLAALGITAIELMPLHSFSGSRGWGYDGVLLFAPHKEYGTPDALRGFIDAAHTLGIMVILDVVYNHFGIVGNTMETYAKPFFDEDGTDWGPAPAFDRDEVRAFFRDNALHWLQSFRFDGLRFDAAEHLDNTGREKSLLVEIAETVRKAIPERQVHLIMEDARNSADALTRITSSGARLIDAQWNDDVHHVLHRLATGETGGLFRDFVDRPIDQLRRSLAEGFVYQGQPRPSKDGERVGDASGHLPPTAFVNFLHNHDQAGNRLGGERLRALLDTDIFAMLEAVLLLSPQIPLMFMGDDYAATTPFFFFSDFPENDLDEERKARLEQAAFFQGRLAQDAEKHVRLPSDPQTFQHSTLDWQEAHSAVGSAARERLKSLIDKRRRFVWPLIDGAYHGARIHPCDGGGVAIDWSFAGGVLSLRANFSAEAIVLPPVTGALFHREGEAGQDRAFTPWSAIFAISPATP